VITEINDSTGDGNNKIPTSPTSIAVDEAGDAYVSGFNSNNVFSICSNGRLSDNVFTISSSGVIIEIADSTGDGAGNFPEEPYSVAVDGSGGAYVVGFQRQRFRSCWYVKSRHEILEFFV